MKKGKHFTLFFSPSLKYLERRVLIFLHLLSFIAIEWEKIVLIRGINWYIKKDKDLTSEYVNLKTKNICIQYGCIIYGMRYSFILRSSMKCLYSISCKYRAIVYSKSTGRRWKEGEGGNLQLTFHEKTWQKLYNIRIAFMLVFLLIRIP